MEDEAKFVAQYQRLNDRVRRIEKGVFNAVVMLSIVAHGFGLFLGFIVLKTDGDIPSESLNLFRAVFGLSDSGIGVLERHPLAGGIAAGIVLLAVAFSLVTHLLLSAELADGRVSTLKASTTVLVLGTVGAWIFIFLLASDGGDTRAVSPATLSLTIAALLSFLLIKLGDYILYNDATAALAKRDSAA